MLYFSSWRGRTLIIVTFFLLLGVALVGTSDLAFGKSTAVKPQHVAPIGDKSTVGSSNPIAFGEPVVIPSTTPTTVTILQKQSFGNAAPPVQNVVALPKGNWQTAILTVTGTEQGRQYDRLMLMWAGNAQIFTGVTPEPTASGIAWTVRKDVSAYLPLLTGTQTFTTLIDNYVTSVYTGIPVVSVSLALYPRDSSAAMLATETWNQDQPNTIVPLTTSPNMVTVHPNQMLSATLTLPNDVKGAYLDLYAIAQINDEFWWGQTPAFRELEISIDGKPAGMVWPFPFVYTGGVNPYLWRPISAINTLNMPAYRVDLTPFAGLLDGKHTIAVNVLNNQDYWLLSGSLFLQEDQGHATTGSVTTDTLSFPTQAQSSTTALIASISPSSNSQVDITAATHYQISGQVHTSQGTFTASVVSSLNFSNDQVYTNPDNWEVVHGFQDVTTDESMVGPQGQKSTRHSDETYTIDNASAFIQTSQSANAFLLPSNLSQTLNVVRDASSFNLPTFHSRLNLYLEAFANLQRGDPAASIPDVVIGSTTAQASFETTSGLYYRRILAARSGTVNMDQLESDFKS
jgi:hypothetical protein